MYNCNTTAKLPVSCTFTVTTTAAFAIDTLIISVILQNVLNTAARILLTVCPHLITSALKSLHWLYLSILVSILNLFYHTLQMLFF